MSAYSYLPEETASPRVKQVGYQFRAQRIARYSRFLGAFCRVEHCVRCLNPQQTAYKAQKTNDSNQGLSRFASSLKAVFGHRRAVYEPTYRAYRLRATPVSVVPLMMARPSGNRVIS